VAVERDTVLRYLPLNMRKPLLEVAEFLLV